MRVFVTGATGLIGTALVARLQYDGHGVAAWVRSESRARRRLGSGSDLVPVGASDEVLKGALSLCDAVVNVAGEPVVPARWTAGRKRVLVDSRVALTHRLVTALSHSVPRPRVLVSASATGYYGDRGTEVLTEDSLPGSDFLARLCVDWEKAALSAEGAGVRVVVVRIGVVLAREGGALAKMLPAFRAGLGGPIGSGRQYVPWIHRSDLVSVLLAALADERYSGPLNVTAPGLVSSREFARELGRAVHRPAVFPVPGLVLRVALGEVASMLLGGQRAEPRRLRQLGYEHRFGNLESALADLLG